MMIVMMTMMMIRMVMMMMTMMMIMMMMTMMMTMMMMMTMHHHRPPSPPTMSRRSINTNDVPAAVFDLLRVGVLFVNLFLPCMWCSLCELVAALHVVFLSEVDGGRHGPAHRFPVFF